MAKIPTIIHSTMAMAEPHTTKVLIWDVSPDWATRLYDWFSLLLIAGAVAAAIGTLGTVLFGVAKEYFANKQISETALEAERLRERNLVFERAIAPRILEQRLTGQRLSSHGGIFVNIRAAPDFEARRTAQQIKYMLLAEAKWKTFEGDMEADPDFRLPRLSYGVKVYSGIGDRALLNNPDTPPEVISDILDKRKATRAATDDLIAVLNENDIRADGGPPIELPSDVILIIVGLKPLPKELGIDPEKFPSDPEGVKMYGNLLE